MGETKLFYKRSNMAFTKTVTVLTPITKVRAILKLLLKIKMHRRLNREKHSRGKSAKMARNPRKTKWSHLIEIVKQMKGKSNLPQKSSKNICDESDSMIDDMRKVGWAKASALSNRTREWISGLTSSISRRFSAPRNSRQKLGSVLWSSKSLQENVLADTKHLGRRQGLPAMINAARTGHLRSGVCRRVKKSFHMHPLNNYFSSALGSSLKYFST